jgi:hypothetical protein
MSSKRRLRRKSCSDKVRFSSEDEARRAIVSLQHRRLDARAGGYRRDEHALEFYSCGFCGGFHVGHPIRSAMDRQGFLGRRI